MFAKVSITFIVITHTGEMDLNKPQTQVLIFVV